MVRAVTDVLMITHNSPDHTRLSIPHLLDTCDDQTRVWLWHNGDHEETLEITRSHATDPRVHRFHHSRENLRLTAPTNWLWAEADGSFLSKVDDDCLPEHGWIQKLRDMHEANPEFGVIGCWRFRDEDFVPHLAEPKIKEYADGHRLLRNLWVQGSGYLVRRERVRAQGVLHEGQSFTQYCIKMAERGAVNGWAYPFIREENLDDPRSPHTLFRTNEDFLRRMPLTAQRLGITDVDDWARQEHESAVAVQRSSLDPRQYTGWRSKRNELVRRAKGLARGRGTW